MTGGHVFIVHGDITRMACDAWLLPSDEGGYVARSWLEHQPSLDIAFDPPDGWGHDGVRTVRLTVPDGDPVPWLTNVGGWDGVELEWYLEAARQFLSSAGSDVRETGTRLARAKPLLALPVVGTGYGGAHEISGDIVMKLLDLLRAAATEHDIDVALVTRGSIAFAAAQRARRRIIDEGLDGRDAAWWALSDDAAAHAVRLATDARKHRLVLFVGAGVSTAAGLPSWSALLDNLEGRAGFADDERRELAHLDSLDRARMIQLRLAETGGVLGDLVAAALDSNLYSLSHALLAAMPVDEVVTTNYDRLFEHASVDAGRAVSVLPYEPSPEESRWLLKLHGSVDHPTDIVLTREDYLRYGDRRAALAGIVQALLITRHMLFVGFSLTDDNFHRIVDEVRKAIRGGDGSGSATTFGTSLHPRKNPLLGRLWSDDLTPVAVGQATSAPGAAERLVEIWLDLLLAHATDYRAHVLDDSYTAALSPAEQEVRDALLELERGVSSSTKETEAWEPIGQLLRDYGATHSRRHH